MVARTLNIKKGRSGLYNKASLLLPDIMLREERRLAVYYLRGVLVE
jgi:hypothetical protein